MKTFNKTITADVPTQSLLKELLIKDIKRLKREIARNQKIGSGKIPRSMRYKQKDLDKS